MHETLDAQTETSPRRFQRAKVLAVPLVCLTLTGCISSGSNKDASSDSSSRHPATSASAFAEPTPTQSAPETNPPDVTVTGTPTEANGAEGLLGCKQYFNLSKYPDHEYEACTAYVVNSAEIALQAFYKFGNSRIGYQADAARHHFETRYWGDARQTVENEVDAWPKTSNLTGNMVDMNVTVLSLTSNLKADRAILQTQESLMVTEKRGVVLHNESSDAKDVTMCRGALKGHPLHEWFVVSYNHQPDFDCIGFDKSNGLQP